MISTPNKPTCLFSIRELMSTVHQCSEAFSVKQVQNLIKKHYHLVSKIQLVKEIMIREGLIYIKINAFD